MDEPIDTPMYDAPSLYHYDLRPRFPERPGRHRTLTTMLAWRLERVQRLATRSTQKVSESSASPQEQKRQYRQGVLGWRATHRHGGWLRRTRDDLRWLAAPVLDIKRFAEALPIEEEDRQMALASMIIPEEVVPAEWRNLSSMWRARARRTTRHMHTKWIRDHPREKRGDESGDEDEDGFSPATAEVPSPEETWENRFRSGPQVNFLRTMMEETSSYPEEMSF